MIIGSMNNPHLNLISEVRWVKKNFDFLDLTLELPKAHPGRLNINQLKKIIGEMAVVGHTAWYLPVGSPFKEHRMAALSEMEKCAAVFEALSVSKMNVHPDNSLPILQKSVVDFNLWSLKRLVRIGKKHGLEIMLENTPGLFSQPPVLANIFRKIPKLKLHLDIGHANIAKKNLTPLILDKLSKKLSHVHISDNNGKADEHLPIGKGNIRWKAMLGVLKNAGYDDTITLEVFTSPADRIASIKKLRDIWDSL